MISLYKRIALLHELSEIIQQPTSSLQKAIRKATLENPWFTQQHIEHALKVISENYLNTSAIEQWLANYNFPAVQTKPKVVGLVMAGNIPLVGFHDFLCVFLSGHKAMVRLSSKDKALFAWITLTLLELNNEVKHHLQLVPQLKNFDAVIATGSNNTARYFDYYFSKYPNIIRKNRNSVAVLTGKETSEEIKQLGNDMFMYFGMGCRNVSKLMVPRDFDFVHLLNNLSNFVPLMHHNKYKNNYDHYRSIYLLNREHHYASEYVMLVQNEQIASPIATIHYEYYDDQNDLSNKLIDKKDQIQCVVGGKAVFNQAIDFGRAQQPRLWDYADGVDTLAFLQTL